MSPDSDPIPYESDRVLYDIGRWASERDAIVAASAHRDDQLNDPLAPLSADRRDQLVDRLLIHAHTHAIDHDAPGEYLPAHAELTELTVETGMVTLPEATPVEPATGSHESRRWGLLASHLGVATATAALAVLLCGLGGPSGPAHPRLTEVQGVAVASDAAPDSIHLCLDQSAALTIAGDDALASEAIEIVLQARDPESGATHRLLHRPAHSTDWSHDATTGELTFSGPLHDLAPLSTGPWVLTAEVGPRGSCGPSPLASCRVLDPISAVVERC